MKKFLAVILSVLLILSLSACRELTEYDSFFMTEATEENSDSDSAQPNANGNSNKDNETNTSGALKEFHNIVQTQTPETDKKEDNQPTVDSQIFEGKGTEKNPYIIKTAEELVLFSKKINDKELNNGEWFALGADIDMNGVKFVPIGNTKNRFSSNFDGRGFTISNLSPELVFEDFSNNGNYCCGFFGAIGNAEVKNLRLKNVNITYTYDSYYFSEIGILAGCIYPTKACKISNCLVNGNISVDTDVLLVGGIAGDIMIVDGAKLTMEQVQSDSKIQLRSDSVNTGVVSGSFLGKDDASFSDICAKSEILHDTKYKSFIGAFGIIGGVEGELNLSNCFFKIKADGNYNTTVYSLFGNFTNSYQPSGSINFKNVFGFMNGCDRLYELPYSATVKEENCAFTEILPANSGFNTEIWDITNPAEPFIRFN